MDIPVCQQNIGKGGSLFPKTVVISFTDSTTFVTGPGVVILLLVRNQKRYVFGFITYLEARTELERYNTRDLAVSGKGKKFASKLLQRVHDCTILGRREFTNATYSLLNKVLSLHARM